MINALLSDPLFDPAPASEAEELARLTRALELSQGFALVLVRAHPSHFARLIAEVKSSLPQKSFFNLHCNTPQNDLLNGLAHNLPSPLPDAVFITGLEDWIWAESITRRLDIVSARFLHSLNVHRNDFPKFVPCPLVLWIPDHILLAIQRYAPDFFSVHSALIRFPEYADHGERLRVQVRRGIEGLDSIVIRGLSSQEREESIVELTHSWKELNALPIEQKNILLESLIMERLAMIYCAQGRYKEAERLYKQALEMYHVPMRTNHPDYATDLSNLSSLYQIQGRYKEAELLCKQALAIRQKILPQGHPSIAQSLNNLAALYDNQGRYEEAEMLCKQALEIFRETIGENHPDYATSLNNLAALYDSQGRYEEAEKIYHRALEIDSLALGENHPDYAASLSNLASLYTNQRRYEEAEELYKKALAIFQTVLPQGHPETAQSLHSLARMYQQQGRYAEAEPLYRQAATMLVKNPGIQHPITREAVQDHLEA